MDRSHAARFSATALTTLFLVITAWPTSAEQQWTRTDFEALFPAPPAGWTVSKLEVQELKTFAQEAGLEQMMNLGLAMNGKTPPAPSVRYKLARNYHRAGDHERNIAVIIDSEDTVGAIMVLADHGYKIGKDGKRTDLSDKEKKKLSSENSIPFSYHEHLGSRISSEGKLMLALDLADKSVVYYVCDHHNCRDDMETLMHRTKFDQLERFVRFDHRKPKADKKSDE